MVERLYSLLASLGYSHPLHPMLTHIPMGMVIGMVIFSLIGLLSKNGIYMRTAFHCSVLALIAVVPVIGAGILDWLQFQQGEWSPFIIAKMVLGSLLTVLLAVSIMLKRKGASPTKILIVYLLCLACASGLGYAGGELVYG